MLIVIAKATVKEGTAGQFMGAAQDVIKETRKETGNISYNLLVDAYDQHKFTFVEKWESKEILDSHMKTAHFNTFGGKIQDILAEQLEIEMYEADKIG
jgi:quinol monooxygenase YgiN